MSVTASLGSLPVLLELRLRRARAAIFFAFRFGIVAGIVLQATENKRASQFLRLCCGMRSLVVPTWGAVLLRRATRECYPSALLLGELPPGVEAVEIENRIQHQRVRPARLAPIHRIDRKQHHVALARGHVQNRGMLRDFIAAFDQAGDEQVFAVGVTQNDPRANCRRDDTISVPLLLVTHRRIFPKLGSGLFGSFGSGAANGKIGIVDSSSAGGPGSAVSAQTAKATAAGDATQRKYRAVITVRGEFLIVAVSDGARGIN